MHAVKLTSFHASENYRFETDLKTEEMLIVWLQKHLLLMIGLRESEMEEDDNYQQ